MPDSSVPCTIRPCKIADPVYGFSRTTGQETAPYTPDSIDVMAIDNLPSELPRDASAFFGRQLLDNVLGALIQGGDNPVVRRGKITENGYLTPHFSYLEDYAAGR